MEADPTKGRVIEKGPRKGEPNALFMGYQPIRTADGQPGIRVIIDKGGPKTLQELQAAIDGPITDMLKKSDLDVRVRGYENELIKARNNWEENPDGQSYLGRLADLGLGSPATRLDPLRGELETAIESWFENRAGAAKPGSGKGAAPTTLEAPAAGGVKRRRGKGTTSAAEDLAAVSPTAPAGSRVEKTKNQKKRNRRRSLDYGLHQARGMKTIVHVNQHVIKSNLKSGEVDPVLTVKTYKTNTYAHEVEITGPCKVIYSPDKPLSCGARVLDRNAIGGYSGC